MFPHPSTPSADRVPDEYTTMQPSPDSTPAPSPMRGGLTAGVALAYAAAGGIHLAVGAQHLGLDRRHAAFFLLVGAWQLGWGILTRRRPSRTTHLLGAGGTLGLVIVWAASRTTGLPAFLGSAGPEPVGSLDLIALGLETGIVVGSTVLARRAGLPQVLRSRWIAASARGAGILLVAALVGSLVLWGPGEQAHDHGPPDAAARHVEITVHRNPDEVTDGEVPSPSEPPTPTPEDAETHPHGDDRPHDHTS